MDSHSMVNQGLRFVTDPESGRSYPIPEGGSSNSAPPPSDSGAGEPPSGEAPSGDTVTPEGQEVQPGSQGFLEPYLSELPEEQRTVVAPVLEKYRQEADANFNRRFQQLQEQAEIPTTLYENLLDDPIRTLNWVADQFEQERGLNLRQELIAQWIESQQDPDPSSQKPEEKQALTQEDINRILEEREQAKETQRQQQEFQRRQQEQATQKVHSWVDEAAKKFSLQLTDIEDKSQSDPLRQMIVMQANALHEQGVAKGQAAIELAAESVAKRFGPLSNGSGSGESNKSEQPVTATGGTPPPSESIDVTNRKQRQARMLEMFGSPTDS